jgi:O-antigen/teichoic acid export membrane protein
MPTNKSMLHLTAIASLLRVSMPVMTMVALARIFPPDSIAPLSVYLMVTAIPVSIVTLRLDDAVAISRSVRGARALSALAVRGVIVVALGTGATIAVLGLTGVLPELGATIWLVAASHAAAFGLWRINCAWLLRSHEMRRWAVADTAGPVLLAAAQVAMAAATRSIEAVLWSFPIAYGLALWLTRHAIPVGTWRACGDRAQVRRGWQLGRRFPQYLIPYSLLGTVRDRVIVALLRGVSQASVGLHYQSERLMLVPSTVVTGALRPITQVAGRGADRSAFISLIERWTVRVALPAGFCAGIGWILAEPLVSVAFGTDYRPAAPYFQALIPAGVVMATTNWLDRLFHLSGTQRLALRLEIFGTALVVASVVVARVLSGAPLRMVQSYGAAFALYQLIWWAGALHAGLGRMRSLGWGLAALIIGGAMGVLLGSWLHSSTWFSSMLS